MRKGVASVILLWQFGAVPSAAAQLTQPERERLVAHLEMTATWLRDEVSGLSPAQLDVSPRTRIVDHPRASITSSSSGPSTGRTCRTP